MKIWSSLIYSFTLITLLIFSLIVMRAVSAPQDSHSLLRQNLNPQDQYLLIDKNQTTTNPSSSSNTEVLCTDTTKGVYVGTSQKNNANTMQWYENCNAIKTSKDSNGWGTTYYWPECTSKPSYGNYRNIDEVGVVCAPATLRWQDIGAHQ
jgi:hypothetical protein